MRKRIQSSLRAPVCLRLENFEDRCLLSSVSFSLASGLLPALAPAIKSVPPLISTATSTVNNAGSVHAGAALPSAAGLAALIANVNPIVNLAGPVIIPFLNVTNMGIVDTALSVASTALGVNLAGPNPVSVQVSTPVGAAVSTIGIAGLSAGVNVKLNDAGALPIHVDLGSVAAPVIETEPAANLNLNLGGTSSPMVDVRAYAGPLPGNSLDILVRADVDHGEGQAIHIQASGPVGVNDTTVQVAVMSPENRQTQIPSGFDNERGNDTVQEPVLSAAPAETALLESQVMSFSALPTSFGAIVLNDLATEAQAIAAGNLDAPPEVRRITSDSGASEADGSALPGPRSEDLLSNARPFDLAALEGDLQAFLEQIGQLGGELSSLLARMNLSPCLVAIAVTAVAGELTRRRLQGPRRAPLLAACEGANLTWFPCLTGPFSREEL